MAIARAGRERRAAEVRVREVMTWGVVTATPTTDLREAARVMRERWLGALPDADPWRDSGARD